MNYMNELLEGKITPEKLQKEYCHYMINLIKKRFNDYRKNEQEFIDNFGGFEYLEKKDRKSLMILIEKILPENLGMQKSRFSDTPFMIRESDFIPKIKEYTDKMLLRLVSNETCQSDLDINFLDSNAEFFNNQMYQILKKLGLNESKKDPYIPEIIPGNYRIMNKNNGQLNKIKKLLEIEQRMEFFVEFLEKNPKEANRLTIKNINDIMRDGSIERILQLRYGKMKTMDSIMAESIENSIALFQQSQGIRTEGSRFKKGTPGYDILENISTRKGKNSGIVNSNTYKKLDKMGYSISFKSGRPILKSGYSLYEQNVALILLENKIKKRILKQSEILSDYSNIMNYYRKNEEKNNNPRDIFITNCMLSYDNMMAEKKANEQGVRDTLVKAGKNIWTMSKYIGGKMVDVETWLTSKVSDLINKNKGNRDGSAE